MNDFIHIIMEHAPWIGLIAVSLIAASFFFRNKLHLAEKRIGAAKVEALQMAGLSMNTPYPIIHLIPGRTILHANPAALIAFEGLSLHHPILADLDAKGGKRETSFAGIVYEQTAVPLELAGEKTLILYCYDIDTLRKTQIALEESRAEAEAATLAKSEFLANMSHELRTPMNGIIGLSDLLAEGQMEPSQTELAQAIHASSKGLLSLLNDILDVSKIEAGELTLESIAFSPRALASQVSALHRPLASQRGLILTCEVAEGLPEFLRGDPLRVQQILNNLAGNAIKFTESGSVAISLDGNFRNETTFVLHIKVQDTGIGIPPEQQKNIFSKFTQADPSITRKYGGTGLGLSITSQLVSMMRGRLELDSAEGKGSIFHVFLPMPLAEGTDAVHISEVQHHGAQFKGRVLVVDDHPVNLLFMRSLLERLGLEDFDEAVSGAEALKKASEKSYDLILMDCQMPEMDGLEATRKIRAIQNPSQNSPIIALTADAMKGASEKCLAAGMNDYLSKPLDKQKIIKIMQQYLSHAPQKNPLKVKMKEAQPTESTNPVFDQARLDEFTGHDAALMQKILMIFLQQAAEDMERIAAAYEVQSQEGWERAVHKLYGSAANVGAVSLAAVCNRIHTPYGEADMVGIHQDILKEYERLLGYFNGRRAAA